MEWYFMCTFQEAAFLLKSCWSSKTQLPHVTIISSSTTPLFLYLFNSFPFLILFILIFFVTFPHLLFFFNLFFSHGASVTLSYVFNFSFYLCFFSPHNKIIHCFHSHLLLLPLLLSNAVKVEKWETVGFGGVWTCKVEK